MNKVDQQYKVTLPNGKEIVQGRFSTVAHAKALGCALPAKVGHAITASYKDTAFVYVISTDDNGTLIYTQQRIEVTRHVKIELLPQRHAASKG